MIAPGKLFVLQAALGLPLLLSPPAHAQTRPDFSGVWKQDGAHSVPTRSGDTTLHIEQHGPELTVETTILRTPLPKKHAVQHYTTDGRESLTKGADGDSFQTQIVWRGPELVFTIVEHEDGHIINTTETWSLTNNGVMLKRVRQNSKSKGEQTILYTRSTAPTQ